MSYNRDKLGQDITHIRAFKLKDEIGDFTNLTKVYVHGVSKIYTYIVDKACPGERFEECVTKLAEHALR
jgi:hypothetical protein